MPYWGYPNGEIPTEAMAPVESRGGTFWLEPSAQLWWLRLASEFERAWGVPLDITDAYRDLAEQQYYWDAYQAGWGNVAARPGFSNHGWGMAVDIYTPVYGSSSSPQHKWLQHWAPQFGWTWDTGRASGESWHWEFATAPTFAWVDPMAPIVENNEEDDMLLYYRDKDTNIIYARDLAIPVGEPALTIIGKNGQNSSIAYTGAPIAAKIADVTGAQIQSLIDWYGVKPVPAGFRALLSKNKPPVKGLG